VNAFYQTSDFKRLIPIEEKEWRSSFYRDYARILHSPSFRRLQGKTPLFPGLESDFFRNRLTHSLEVAPLHGVSLNCQTLRLIALNR